MVEIHPTSLIGKGVELGSNVKIGPFSIVKGKSFIDDNTVVDGHAQVGSEFGVVHIGKNNHIFPGAMIGGAPQDKKYNCDPTELVIGDDNTIREFTTLNIGTVSGGGQTKIGHGNLLMAYVHVAHDCVIGNHTVVANSTQFAGHVKVNDYVTIGGCSAISQYITVGEYVYIGGDSTINKDILPYCMAEGKWAVMRATNKVGLSRNGFSQEVISNIHKALRTVIKGGRTIDEAVLKIKQECTPSAEIDNILNFIENSKKGLAR